MKPAFLSSQQRSISENCAVGLLTDDSGKHCLNRKQPEITFREQQNLSRSVCRTQKLHFLHESASLEPKNVMSGTPRVALLKKERCCCKYDLILQQPQCLLVHSRLLAVCKHFVNIWRGFSPPNCHSHGKGGNYGKDQANCSRVFRRQAKSVRCLYNCILQSVAVPAS